MDKNHKAMNDYIRRMAGRLPEVGSKQSEMPEVGTRIPGNAGDGTGNPPKQPLTMTEIIRRIWKGA